MVRTHPSTPEQRAQWTALMLAHQGQYGSVTRLSRESGVSRPTLYAWREKAQQALLHAFSAPLRPPGIPTDQARQILTAWVLHASDRGIQTAMRELARQGVSLATITAVLAEAQQRALRWMQTHIPSSVRALALDEIYANNRCGAYLNVVDVHSGAVWASEGPLPVDTDSWTLLLWSLQDRQLRWDRLVADDGAAIAAACRTVSPQLPLQRDQWHLWHRCAQVQARLSRWLRKLELQTPIVARQAARLATHQRPRGPNPKTDLSAHAQEVERARGLVEALRVLTHELRRLLSVVVIDQRGVLDAAQRQADVAAALELLAEVVECAPAPQQAEVQRLQTCIQEALPQVLTFVAQLDQVQHDLRSVLAPERQALLGWAWLRRKALGWSSHEIVAAIPADWQDAARVLLASWDAAVRVSSAVERWHSILRPHLAVHRTLSTGMLALLAVWHNHRVFTRGVHKGKSPLHLSGMLDAPTDWLLALGYPPPGAAVPPTGSMSELALAA
jgi:transposase-like protein